MRAGGARPTPLRAGSTTGASAGCAGPREGANRGRSGGFIDPQEAFRLPGFECPDGKLAGLGHEWMLGLASGEPRPVRDKRAVVSVAAVAQTPRRAAVQRQQAQRLHQGQPREPEPVQLENRILAVT